MNQTLECARRSHANGDYEQTERLCLQILGKDGQHTEAWWLLGSTRQRQGKSEEAVTAYRQLLHLQPDHREALLSLGLALAEADHGAEAAAHWGEVVRRHPHWAVAHHNHGVALAQVGKSEQAAQSLRQALDLQPNYPEACYNLGNVLSAAGQSEQALASYRQALTLKPDYAEAYNNLGWCLIERGRAAEAVPLLQQAMRLRPQMSEAINNLGLAFADLGSFAEAEAQYQEALRLNPLYAEAHANLGNLYKEQGYLPQALSCYEIALWVRSESVSPHWNRALAWLQHGAYAQGWPEYEWRWQRKGARPRLFPQPPWDGSPLAGQSILLYTEQGLGDMLQFIRYAEVVQRRGGQVIVECPGILVPLFSRCRGIHRLVAEGSPLPAFDAHAALMSLPRLLGTTLETIPAEIPYLFVDTDRRQRWRQQLASLSEFKVGISWQGNPHHPFDRHRSVPLAAFAPLARLPGIQLISLQKGPGREQIQTEGHRFPLIELALDEDPASGVFLDMAAVMQQLDLVVTVDTAVAHLAGGLEVPVWIALGAMTDWRWLRDREDSPWYPSARLFRQRRWDDWQEVFERMAAALEQIRR